MGWKSVTKRELMGFNMFGVIQFIKRLHAWLLQNKAVLFHDELWVKG